LPKKERRFRYPGRDLLAPPGSVPAGRGVWQELHALLLARLRAAGELEWSRAIADSS
jgi:hypothetical protein